jgi:hypothetical protein
MNGSPMPFGRLQTDEMSHSLYRHCLASPDILGKETQEILRLTCHDATTWTYNHVEWQGM